MKRMRRTWNDSGKIYLMILGVFSLLAVTFFSGGSAFSADEDTFSFGAVFSGSTLVLNIPELAVEGSDLLYSAKLQLKQDEENLCLELIDLELLQNQEISELAAVIAADGTMHIPLMNYNGSSFWSLDLRLIDSSSLLPIRFGIVADTVKQISSSESSVAPNADDSLLGMAVKCKWISQGKMGWIRFCCRGRDCWIDEVVTITGKRFAY